jgi:glycosyltransferase involved in cell wall biosynthesis
LVVCGNQEAQRLLGYAKKYHGPSAVLPQFGIEYEKYQRNAKPEIARRVARQVGTPVIGFMGRLVPEKGILLLCEALDGVKHLPWKLVIVAGGPLEEDLQERWKPLFGDRLLLLGSGARADLPDYLKCLDILVVPSLSTPHWKEQFGYILVEAMASGVAVIGSSSGAIPEGIGDAGMVFPEGDVSRLREALTLLLQSIEKRNELSRLGRERAQKLFSHEAVSASYMKLFQQFNLS